MRRAATRFSGLAICFSVALGLAAQASAATFDVSSALDDGSAGTLRWAIQQANTAGAGDHTITFSVGSNSTIELADDLPELDNTSATSITLDGVGASGVTISGHDNHRVLFVATGNWFVSNVNIVHGLAKGGDGGALSATGGGGGGLGDGGAVLVNDGAHLTVLNVNFSNNQATGGNGGQANGAFDGGSGGGGNGGNAGNFSGGGGGGLHGDGGAGGIFGGGGGGGLLLDGSPGGFIFGGLGALLGGNGGDDLQSGQDGLTFGGGGGGGELGHGGAGGDFGGGGGGGLFANGGDGGFGAGGGGAGDVLGDGGQAGFGAGNGGAGTAGDGGSGYGGAIFVRQGGTLTILNSNSSANGVTAGTGANNGNAAGQDLYLMSGVNVQFGGLNNSYAGSISGDGSLTNNAGTTILTGTNTYTGGTSVLGGVLQGNTLSLQGPISNQAYVTFDQSFDGTYAGSITGTGTLLKLGVGNLTLTNTGNSQGTISIQQGTVTGTTSTLNASSFANYSHLVFDQNFDGTVSAFMYGSGSLTKNGTGSVSLLGVNTYTGPTEILNGRLAVNGSINSDTTVHAGATLGGSGQINGAVVNSGTVAPGNSIGTLTINGNYTVNSGSTQQVEINDGGNTPGVNNDLLVVNGNASLQGGTVDVQASSGTYTPGTTYTFLAANSISGQYAGITLTGLPSTMHAILGYDTFGGSSFAFFTLLNNHTDFVAIAQTFNERQVAGYLDDISGSASGEMSDILNEMQTLSVPEQRVVLNQMTGVVNGTIAQLGVQDTTFLYMILRRRVGSAIAAGGIIGTDADSDLASANSADSTTGLIMPVSYNQTAPSGATYSFPTPSPAVSSWGGWTSGYGFGGSAQTDGNAAGGTYGSGGTILAMERALDESSLLGFFGAYSHLGLTLRGLPQRASANQGLFGSYLLRDLGSAYVLAAGSVGFAGYHETRQVVFGNVNSTAQGDYDGWQPSAYLEYGRRWGWGRTMLQPYGALQYIYVRQNGFTETGAGVLDQSVAGIDTHALRGMVGARAAQTWLTNSGRAWVPEVRAVWMHEFLDPDTTLTATFAPIGGGSFATRGLNFGRDWAVLGTGTQYVLNQSVSLFANYDLLFNTQQAWNAGSGGLQYAW